MKHLLSAAVAFAAFASMPAQAATYIYNGTTAGGPTYNRVLAGIPPTGLSGVGTAARYNALTFTVDVAGSYSFFEQSNYDNFLTLYKGSFLPGSALTNALVAIDDSFNSNASFTTSLLAGTTYIAVMTGFGNNDSGAFRLTIDGPGRVSVGAAPAVPEPASWAMMMGGLAIVGAAMRRRQTTVSFA